ncbi:MAG: beta-N-acetylhexosaminidase [Deltaproteobacteria bacterium]|nr:beta-N-acetylhexosaminidase [Deltaproteobacteria bacterium]
MSDLSLSRLAARTLVIGFEGLTLPEDARALLARGVGGVILFKRNLESAPQVMALIDACRAAAPGPIWVSVDQEGGRVARLKGLCSDLPPMLSLDSPEEAAAAGRVLARELSALGFDLDYTPVMDVLSNPANPVIGDRAFGRTVEEVLAHALPLLEALQEGGVAACAKHFPGHGDTEIDSHVGLPVVEHDLGRLRALELKPFAEAIAAGVTTVMTAHLIVKAIDPELPATMSAKVLSILRDELGFDGLCLSDDLEMGAVAERWPVPEAGLMALQAGVDQVLICHQAARQRGYLEAIEVAVEDGRLPLERLEQAVARIDAAMECFAPDRDRPAWDAAWTEGEATSVEYGDDPTGGR